MRYYLLFLGFLTISSLLWQHEVIRCKKDLAAPSLEKLFPSEDYFMMKQYPEKVFHVNAYLKALQQALDLMLNAGARRAGEWEVQGPGNLGARANTIAVNPYNPDHILIGYSEGGLFLTMDGGNTWDPVFDDLPGLSIGDVVFDPINPSIVYAGTGDPNISGYPFIGNGIYKSLDGGKTWKQSGLQNTRVISQIRISKQNPDVIYVGAMGLPFEKNQNKGVYKSTDGGSTWKQVLFVNDSTGICDLVIHPGNDKLIYAAGWNRIRNNKVSVVSGPDARIYKSSDGGNTWQTLQGGLPQDASSRIGIDISQSNPNVLYACYTHPTSFNLKGIYKSVDGGNSWITLPIGGSNGLAESVYGGFGWYFGKIRINPKDPDDIFLLAVDIFRSRDGGQSWKSAGPAWWTYEVHADKHDLIFVENNMYLTTDGGAYMSEVSTENWKDIENIPTTQFYRVAYNPHKPDIYYGGAQDNGTSGGGKNFINDWPRIYGGDGFQAVFHPSDSLIFYVETQNGGIAVTTDGGKSYNGATFGIDAGDPRNWDMPYLMSPHNPDILFAGTNKIYRSTTGTDVDFKPISPDLTDPNSDFLRHNISALDQSSFNPNFILAGSSDGLVWLTKDGGGSWENISVTLPKKYVSSCVFSASSSAIYIAYTGYKDNDSTPYIYTSTDFGRTWRSIQGNLPRAAVNNILPLPADTDIADSNIVVATDAGVYYTSNGGTIWNRLGTNMPILTVYDVAYNPANNQVVAGTFGRSIQTFDMKQAGYPQPSFVRNEVSAIEISLQNTLISNEQPLLVKNETEKRIQYYIADACGNIVIQGNTASAIHQIDTQGNWTSGLYFFIYKTGFTQKEKAIRFAVF